MLRVRVEMDAGRTPQTSFLEGLLLFIGGILLILPGLIGDTVGLLLLIPFVRHLAAPRLSAYLTARQASGTHESSTRIFFFQSGGFPAPDPDQIIFDETPPQEDLPPRQATIIESTAIEIEPQSPSQSPTQSADKPDVPTEKTP